MWPIYSTFLHWFFSMCWKIPIRGHTSYYWFSTFPHVNHHVTSIPVRVTSGYFPQFYMEYFWYNEKFPIEGWTSLCRFSTFPHSIYHVTPTVGFVVTLHSTFPHGIFLCYKKFHQEDGHLSMDFLHLYIQFIMPPLH